jgi:hypothetical protein
MECSAACCSHPGFAVLENVLEIYELYRQRKLKRKGHKFAKGLSLVQFIYTYFDVWERDVGPTEEDKQPMIFFHAKCIDEKGLPISIPPGESFWTTRDDMFRLNPWLNWGCVFLSHKVPEWNIQKDDGFRKRRCILHQPNSLQVIGPKPIDCLFHTCTTPLEVRIPTQGQTDEWFYVLSLEFPNSKERFLEIMDQDQ